METLIPIAIILFGAIIGAAIAWAIMRAKAQRSYDDGKADSATEIATLNERVAAKDREIEKLREAFTAQSSELGYANTENSRLEAELEGERRAAQERHESFQRVSTDLAEKFKALSRDALKDNNQEFLNLARATLERFQATAKGDLEQRQQAIDQLVKPLRDSLEKVDGKIGEIEKARAGAYAELREQVRALATSQLQLQAKPEIW